MKIQFRKTHNKPSILTCIRADGSKTWVKMYPGMEPHDLGHYAVETILKFENAFYGMVAKGIAIGDFERPRNERPAEALPQNLAPEALITEHLVNLLMTKAQTKDNDLDIITSLKPILKENGLPFPEHLTVEKMERIWTSFLGLNTQWNQLPNGATLELEFLP